MGVRGIEAPLTTAPIVNRSRHAPIIPCGRTMPESEPGDGEINDVDEFLQELGRVERDETLIDFIGQGYDVNAPGDQDVADLLGAWRDDVGREPVNVELPSAAIARGEVPRAPTRGGTLGTTQENAAIIRSQTEKVGEAVASLAHAMDLLADARNAAIGVMGQTAAADTLNAIVEGTINAINDAQGQTMSLNAAFETASTAGA